ncbi:MAG TPA: S1/P1 nuclease [Rhizomicrobium sp.]|jgi:hypothetical protein|nr:S1/P1 nuclease [Rhizomicrobium sp.]
MRFLLALLLLVTPGPALAWGAEGHEIVASIALGELTPQARAQVAGLLGSPALLVHESNWADEIREQRPETASWHYVDIPLAAPGYDARRDCAWDDCVVAQIDNDRRILAERGAPSALRAQALRFLIHLVADIHQPLHVEDNGDKGGNGVRVMLNAQRTNLHHVWDVSVVEPLGFDAAAAARRIEAAITPGQRRDWAAGTAADWANEAHAIARDQIYPALRGRRSLRLAGDYDEREAPVARLQLARAGVRLAWLLNTALK